MDIQVQILCFIVSFIYGVFYNLISKLNYKIIENKNVFLKIVITSIFIFNSIILYLIILYKINFAIYHIYFLFILILGYIFSSRMCKYIVKLKK